MLDIIELSALSIAFLASAKTISFTRNANVFVSIVSAATSKLSVRICSETYAPTNDARDKSSIERGALLKIWHSEV